MAGEPGLVSDPRGLSETEALERLFEMSLDMLGTASRDGYLMRLNPAWERTLGWSRQELMAEPFVAFVHPDDVEATIATAAALAEPGRQELVNFENRYRTRAGDYRWLEWSSIADGDTIYFVAKDVTARKESEAERSEDHQRTRCSEARHRTLTANLPDTTVFLLDHDLRILLADGEAARRLPWFSDDLFIGRQVSDLYSDVPGGVLDLAIENYTAVLQGERRRFEFSSGGITFEVQGAPVHSDDGAVESALVLARDVTEQQRLTSGLRRSEERLRKAERLVGGGSWELDLGEQTLTFSDGLGQIHGAAPAGGNEPLTDYLERVDPADRAAFNAAISRCVREGNAAFEYRTMGRYGEVRTLTAETEVVQPIAGRAHIVRGAVLDVTDERAGFDAAPVGMLVADPEQLRLVRVNDALCALLGRSREQLLGERIADLTHPDDRGAIAEQRRMLIAGPTATYQTEKRYLRPDGSAVWVVVYMTALHNADGSVRAFSSQVIDITERRNRDREVEAARVESLRRLAIASEYRDNETFEHTERVGMLSVAIGQALGMSEPQLALLRQAAPLHDIGKVGISDLILHKPGRFTPDERRIMERHTQIGADIVSGSDSPVLKMAEDIALTHHERWDGEGYPNKLAGESIPLVGRIVAIADVFDALTHSRPYKEAWHEHQAMAHICAESGSHFDPAVVSAFTKLDRAALFHLEPEEEAVRAANGLSASADEATPDAGVVEPADEGAADRERAAAARDWAAAARDRDAASRDQTAAERDQCEDEVDPERVDQGLRAVNRALAALDRQEAAADRVAAAADRDQAQVELRRAHIDPLAGARGRGPGTVVLGRRT